MKRMGSREGGLRVGGEEGSSHAVFGPLKSVSCSVSIEVLHVGKEWVLTKLACS